MKTQDAKDEQCCVLTDSCSSVSRPPRMLLSRTNMMHTDELDHKPGQKKVIYKDSCPLLAAKKNTNTNAVHRFNLSVPISFIQSMEAAGVSMTTQQLATEH